MDTYRVASGGFIDAEPSLVYLIIADYRKGHPGILPREYFSPLTIEEGGFGAGTKLRFSMQAYGRKQSFHVHITEPESGKILVETDDESGAVTTFRIVPADSRGRSRVTIETELIRRRGPLGSIERFVTTKFLEKVYAEELRLLAVVAEEWKRKSGIAN
jgi:hypothetical protein